MPHAFLNHVSLCYSLRAVYYLHCEQIRRGNFTRDLSVVNMLGCNWRMKQEYNYQMKLYVVV